VSNIIPIKKDTLGYGIGSDGNIESAYISGVAGFLSVDENGVLHYSLG